MSCRQYWGLGKTIWPAITHALNPCQCHVNAMSMPCLVLFHVPGCYHLLAKQTSTPDESLNLLEGGLTTPHSSICLCALSSPVYPTYPHTAILARSQRNQSPIRADDPHARVALDPGHETIVLNRCKHAFHLACLKSWFEYRRYKCPICQASYSPEEEACGLRPPT